jgi:hypothetical protein
MVMVMVTNKAVELFFFWNPNLYSAKPLTGMKVILLGM